MDSEIWSAGFPDRGEITSGDFYRDRSNSFNKYNARKLVLQAVQQIHNSEKCPAKNLTSLSHQTNPVPPRNVKLIRMISNEPIPEETEEEGIEEHVQRECGGKINKADVINEDEKQLPKAKEGNLQQPISQLQHTAGKGKSIKVHKETTKVILQYKKMLCEYRKTNVMYKKGIKVKPCELVLRISDQIIHDILLEISSGMESENLLDQLYRNELLEVT